MTSAETPASKAGCTRQMALGRTCLWAGHRSTHTSHSGSLSERVSGVSQRLPHRLEPAPRAPSPPPPPAVCALSLLPVPAPPPAAWQLSAFGSVPEGLQNRLLPMTPGPGDPELIQACRATLWPRGEPASRPQWVWGFLGHLCWERSFAR